MSGVPRTTRVLVLSSSDMSATFSTVFSTFCMVLPSALDSWNTRTFRSWYSFCLAAVAG